MFARKTRQLLFERLADRTVCAVDIVFDYSLDTSNFFNAGTSNGQSARSLLEVAAKIYESRLADNLEAIVPSGTNTWTASFFHPATGNQTVLSNLRVNANQLLVFVGARDLPGLTLGEAGPGGWNGTGTQQWLNTLRGRGQTGAIVAESSQTDFGPWGGSLSFDNAGTNWSFSEQFPAPGQSDFFSVALHELGHILGFGISDSWANLVRGSTFTGARSRSVFGNNVPLHSDNAHWAEGTSSFQLGTQITSEASFAPFVTQGSRKPLTELDFAGLDDIGWDVINPTASVSVTQSGGSTTVSEGGATDTLSFALNRPASVDVWLTLTPEAGLDLGSGAGVPVMLNFKPASSVSTQTITVRAVDDTIIEGNHTNRITVSIDSADTTFDALANIVLNVSITDNDFNSPPTNILLSNLQIAENRPSGTIIGQFSTVDANVSDTFVYTFIGTGNDNGLFQIVNGQLIALQSFNFETKSTFRITVRTTDPLGATFDKTFDIAVQNVNEPPTFLNLSDQTILSGLAVGTVIGDFSSSDPDTGDTVSIQLVGGSGSGDNSKFEIVNRQLRSRQVFDKSIQGTLQIRVAATDSSGASIEKNFTIFVLDESDFSNEDINLDKIVSAADVILIVNEINLRGSGILRPDQDRRLDTDRNGFLSPVDVIRVINEINARSAVIPTPILASQAQAEPETITESQVVATDHVFQIYNPDSFEPVEKKNWQRPLAGSRLGTR